MAALAGDVVKVTADNYVRAETDYQVKTYVEGLRCFGKFIHGTPGFQINQGRHDIDDDIYGDGSKPEIET